MAVYFYENKHAEIHFLSDNTFNGSVNGKIESDLRILIINLTIFEGIGVCGISGLLKKKKTLTCYFLCKNCNFLLICDSFHWYTCTHQFYKKLSLSYFLLEIKYQSLILMYVFKKQWLCLNITLVKLFKVDKTYTPPLDQF